MDWTPLSPTGGQVGPEGRAGWGGVEGVQGALGNRHTCQRPQGSSGLSSSIWDTHRAGAETAWHPRPGPIPDSLLPCVVSEAPPTTFPPAAVMDTRQGPAFIKMSALPLVFSQKPLQSSLALRGISFVSSPLENHHPRHETPADWGSLHAPHPVLGGQRSASSYSQAGPLVPTHKE